ncbi:MAG: hypothetical protein ACKO96_03420 [Flammeovirgaceae bacterium]
MKTRTKALLLIFSLLTIGTINAQSPVLKPAYLNCRVDDSTRDKIFTSLDTLFNQVKNRKLDPALIHNENRALSISTIISFAGIEENKEDGISDYYKKQLINLYPISANEYWISLAFIGHKNSEAPVLKTIINVIATDVNNNIVFSIPTKYLTKTWKSKVVGNVTYFYRDNINIKRATSFNTKNTETANKLGLKPEKLDFYMCNNYQEVMQILGYEYDADANGRTRDGYGVVSNTIFSIMNNEDFSHDIFHFYSAKIRGDIRRNSTTEEGIAYSWGNAYYTNVDGEMIEQKELIRHLKTYLKENPKASLLELFNNSPKIFNHLAPEISVKSTVSSLLCDEVNKKKGIEGIKRLIKCGRGDDNFFKTVDNLIAINQTNFDTEVMKLVEQYKK